MRLLLASVAALGLMTTAALADPMAPFYENTVEVTAADGSTRAVLINEDGSYQQVAGDATVDGTWELKGEEEACFSSAATAESGPYCVAATERAVGDSWEMTAPDGSTETATLKAGR
ncbi:hypothetical protein [Pyruvatibacter mobilis]|jgi:hypothetical protein|uniref:Uncharacterized protein n=1 Tax=Pyruvatibacter mobilis TaxID=1712261 RepID=A0A845QE54_9HYPH|nr:hypothetical protein [Pyruvatibacter mobilis]NBG96588.1 hypothetical protein [Pyruvatibacter mobilis]QJD74530.1 hypothetical protein HG718_03395 [Pyruvatibacter mobilis]GGD07787.1 hypothetical protein GCM10011587_09680 [Pyruvatibacter mobilis]